MRPLKIFDSAGKRLRHAAKDFAIAGLAAAALVLTGHANAVADTNTDQFLTDMADNGFQNGSGNRAEINVGLQICAELAGGVSEDNVVHNLWMNSQMDEDMSSQFVDIAVKDLCPGDSA